jgi:hypothetical protein
MERQKGRKERRWVKPEIIGAVNSGFVAEDRFTRGRGHGQGRALATVPPEWTSAQASALANDDGRRPPSTTTYLTNSHIQFALSLSVLPRCCLAAFLYPSFLHPHLHSHPHPHPHPHPPAHLPQPPSPENYKPTTTPATATLFDSLAPTATPPE